MLSSPCSLVLALTTLASLATATPQWSSDAAANQVLSDGAGAEVQAKLVAAPDGSAYASWFDSDPAGTPAFGYDVVLQRLDPAGSELWPHGGVTVADRGFSSTQDYGLAASPDGSALLAFRDDRLTGVQVTAARVDADGSQPWGPLGVQLTNTTDFLAAPHAAVATDGYAVVGWTQGGTSLLQRLAPDGTPQWGPGVALPTPAGMNDSVSSVIAADAGAVVVSWIRQGGAFGSPRHFHAQKFSDTGAPLWGAGGVVLFDAGSIQFGNFPGVVPDGSGGAVAAWYDVSPLQCYAQHVRPGGALAFGTNGVAVSTDATQIRVSPTAAYAPETNETFVFWTEQNTSQSMSGVSGQKLGPTGARLWGSSGITYVPVGGNSISFVNTVRVAGGAAAVWLEGSGFAQDQVRGVRVDGAGATVHAIATLASTPSSKGRLVAIAGRFDDVQAAWHGDEGGDDDVLAQNLRADGGLGPAAGGIVRTAGANVLSYSATVGPLGGTLGLDVDLTTTGHAFAVVAVFLDPASVPFGADVLLVDLASPGGELLGLPPGIGPSPHWSVPIPLNPAFSGLSLATQAAHLDLVIPLKLANAVDVYLGL